MTSGRIPVPQRTSHWPCMATSRPFFPSSNGLLTSPILRLGVPTNAAFRASPAHTMRAHVIAGVPPEPLIRNNKMCTLFAIQLEIGIHARFQLKAYCG